MAPVDKPKHAGKAIIAGGVSGALEVPRTPYTGHTSHSAVRSPDVATPECSCRVPQICCTYPLEYVKTVSQLSTGKSGAMDVVKNTLRERGPLGFYRGLSSMIYFATPKAAIRFSAFEQANTAMRDENNKPMFGSITSFLAGVAAGIAEAIVVTTPQAATAQRRTAHHPSAHHPRGISSTLHITFGDVVASTPGLVPSRPIPSHPACIPSVPRNMPRHPVVSHRSHRSHPATSHPLTGDNQD